jgi:hypothetical protein
VVNQREAEDALAAWASIERDELVRTAHAAGVSKNRIHTITGIARTTIDRILDQEMSRTQNDRLVSYLERFTAGWPRQGRYALQPAMASVHTAEQVAEILLGDAEFRALRLGALLGTADGRLIVAAVEALTPPPYREDVALLAEALQLAAKRQQNAAIETLLRGVAVAVGVGVVAAAFAGARS